MTPSELAFAVAASIASLHAPEWDTQWLAKSKHPLAVERRADIQCLAQVVYHEMRGESAECQVMVAYTALDRYAQAPWPLTLCDVVKQPGQFAPKVRKKNTIKEPKAWAQSVEIAVLTYTGMIDRPKSAEMTPTYFHETSITPRWAASFTPVAEKCGHRWYAE